LARYWAPVINVARDPRWGRNLEAAGEDPMVTGQYAISFVSGFQSAPEAPALLQASACCKHFVANELEAWNGTDRYHFDAIVTAQDLAETCAARPNTGTALAHQLTVTQLHAPVRGLCDERPRVLRHVLVRTPATQLECCFFPLNSIAIAATTRLMACHPAPTTGC
jgi:hypothetical protein